MILELQKMELDGDLIKNFIWISGKRIIAQSTDGVSGADLLSRVMGGQRFFEIPPIERNCT